MRHLLLTEPRPWLTTGYVVVGNLCLDRMSTAAAEVVGGRDEVVRTLGQGAFGHTFLATDRQENRSVAVKVLDTRSRPDEKAYQLFRREAEVLRAIRHHGIPEVFDTFQGV